MSKVRFNSVTAIKEIPITPNNKCSDKYPTKKLRVAIPEQTVLEPSLDHCPCLYPNSPKIHPLSKKQDWLNCDSCNQWFHRECLAINSKIYNKNYSKDEPYSCISCVFKLQFEDLVESTTSKLDSLFLSESIVAQIKESITLAIVSQTKHLVPSHTNPTEANLQPVEDLSNTQLKSDQSVNTTNQHTQQFSPPSSPPPDFLNTSPIPLNLTPPFTSTPPGDISIDTPIITLQHPTSDITDQQTDNIVILDGINEPHRYKDSSTILREINTAKPTLSCKYAYKLDRGGIAIHCLTASDKQEALQPWPDTAFHNSKVSPHPPRGRSSSHLVVRNIPKATTDTQISDSIYAKTGLECTVSRFYNYRTQEYMPVARLRFSNLTNDTASSLITEGIRIDNYTLVCEPYRDHKKVTRCYNCHKYGHIAVLKIWFSHFFRKNRYF